MQQERDNLRSEVSQLRQELERIQTEHTEEVNAVKEELTQTQTEKTAAETQYRKLLDQVNRIKQQLGERLRTDAEELEKARGILQKGGYKATSTTSPNNNILSVGVGFLGWKLDEPDGKASQLLTVALEARVSAVWLSFGNNLEKWVAFVREFDDKRAEPHTTLIFILVNSLQDARVAVEDLKADVVVAQGTVPRCLAYFVTSLFQDPFLIHLIFMSFVPHVAPSLWRCVELK